MPQTLTLGTEKVAFTTRKWHVVALLLIVFVAGLMWLRTTPEPLSEADQPFYLGIAYDLHKQHIFTDGFIFADQQIRGERPPGMRVAPIYPSMLAATMSVDPAFKEGVTCIAVNRINEVAVDPGCPKQATLARAIQFASLVAILLMIFAIAYEIIGGPRPALIAVGLSFFAVPLLLRYVNYLMTEMTSITFFTAAMTALVFALRRLSIGWAAAAGVLFALTALTRPSYFYFLLAAMIAGAIGVLISRQVRDHRWMVFAFIAGGVLCLTPWIARNAIVLGHANITRGYDSHTLAQRVAYNTMTWRELGMSFVCWGPDGNGIGNKLFGPGSCDKFGWAAGNESFYGIGQSQMIAKTVSEAGGWDNHLRYLVKHYVLGDALKHTFVTISMALRGAWISHWWGFILGIVCAFRTYAAIKDRNTSFLAITLPCWFMALFHAAVSANQVRYNMFLVFPYAICGADLIEYLLVRRQTAAPPSHGCR